MKYSQQILQYLTLQMQFPDKYNCVFDSVLFFFGLVPAGYKGAALRLQLIYEMALHPEEYKVIQNIKCSLTDQNSL